jgi:hypothetical protein
MARRSSAFSRLSALTCSDSAVVSPGRCPESISARRIHLRNVSDKPIPNLPATASIAANSEGNSVLPSATMRIARSRNSRG